MDTKFLVITLLAVIFSFAAPSRASETEDPLLARVKRTESKPPAPPAVEECKIYAGKVYVTTALNVPPISPPLRYTKDVPNLAELRRNIVLSNSGKFEPVKDTGAADAPVSRYAAYLKLNIGPPKQIPLKETGKAAKENTAEKAVKPLLELVDLNCDLTPEEIAVLSDTLYQTKLKEEGAKVGEGFFLSLTDLQQRKSGKTGTVYVLVAKVRASDARDAEPAGAFVATVSHDGQGVKVDSIKYDATFRP